jgi:hypothetical protein
VGLDLSQAGYVLAELPRRGKTRPAADDARVWLQNGLAVGHDGVGIQRVPEPDLPEPG